MPRWVLPFILCVYVVLTAALIARVPYGATPDEIEHLRFARYVAEHRALPYFERQVPESDNSAVRGGNAPGFEYHQPPLYYVVCAPLIALVPPDLQFYVTRLVSLWCGVLTLVLLWRSIRALWPHDPLPAAVATGFAALWPFHQSVGAMTNNDAMAGLAAAAVFHHIAHIGARGWRGRDAAILGLLIGLGILSKSTSLVLGIMALGAAWHFSGMGRPGMGRPGISNEQRVPDATANDNAHDEGAPENKSVAPRVRAALLLIVVTLLVCGPWMVRNQVLYGDLLALGAISQRFENIGSRTWMFFASGYTLDTYLRNVVLILFCTTWGFFGGPGRANTMLNPWGVRGPVALLEMGPLAVSVTVIGMLVCVVATAVALAGLLRASRRWAELPTNMRAVLGWWGIGALLIFAAWARFNFIQFQAQARYLHPALLPFALAFAIGWLQLLGRGRALRIGAIILGLTVVGLTLWNVFGWRTLTD
jgi:hypothetical protein